MDALQFRPYQLTTPARALGCYACKHFHGRFLADHLVCEERGGRQVIGSPRMGCAFWEREPGSDDE
jgi:hypothetical protein